MIYVITAWSIRIHKWTRQKQATIFLKSIVPKVALTGYGRPPIMLKTAEDTDGQYSCIEELLPGSAAPLTSMGDETFYIMEGEATFL